MKTSLKACSLRPLFLSIVLSIAGCPVPQKIGDVCAPNGPSCPSGSVCTPDENVNRCMIPMGGDCNDTTDDCVPLGSCEGGICVAPPGWECEPTVVPDICGQGSVCDPAAKVCAMPEGAPCGYGPCLTGLVCVDNPASMGEYICAMP